MTQRVAVVDFGLGNLFSVAQACRRAGLEPEVTDSGAALLAADALILPGVGAFGDAMRALRERRLIEPIREFAASGKTLLGICLGMQLLMRESEEFGQHPGLGLLPGRVAKLPAGEVDRGRRLKVPHVGWNPVNTTPSATSLFEGIPSATHFYFVHSYYVVPDDPSVVAAETPFGSRSFCSAIQSGSILACQFHPERSGPAGLRLYENLATILRGSHE